MELQINPAIPRIMHIDLNSCFASVEQQANPLIRNRPVVVAAYKTPNACILSPSIEAKRHGIKVGYSVAQGKSLCPDLIVLTTDPPKYRIVNQAFIKILKEYSAKVIPKSIDEAIVDFNDPALFGLDLFSIGREIKYRIKNEIGDWLRCNVGIATNRFLAKTASGINKPDGLELINKDNLLTVYSKIELLDIYGINVRYEARLKSNGIFTPLDFFNSSIQKLHKSVFKSINGYHWYYRLRGWEVDSVEFERRSIGHEYSLKNKTADLHELNKVLMKLCEKVGRRLRRGNYVAQGVYLACRYTDHTHYGQSRKQSHTFFSSQDLYKYAQKLLYEQPEPKVVRNLAVGCFDLQATSVKQLELFNSHKEDVVKALDQINDRYGEFIVTSANMMGTREFAPDAIAFGNVKELNYD